MTTGNWYELENPELADSPSLLIYPDHIEHNINHMIKIAGSPERLIPHVKTYKMREVVEMQVKKGITKFKAATIAEAEMAASAGATFVIIAHQLVGPKIERLVHLCKLYPAVTFSSLVDNYESTRLLQKAFSGTELQAHVFVDVNNAMDRSGHLVNSSLFDFYEVLSKEQGLICLGLHVYDGNFRDQDFRERKTKSDTAFAPVKELIDQIKEAGLPAPMVVVGGTPSFTVHAQREGVFCSPGTCLIWDWGYDATLPEQDFKWAGLLFTRVISKPRPGYITTDLGHKAVAAENPIDKRVKFLNLGTYKPVSQSEEHLVLEVENWESINVGDVLYGVPYHICPSINLYEEAYVVKAHAIWGTWQVIGRKRKISV
jgi:3-hydroxy-D-aspartate aldolase